jgi:hypothetical protein
LNGQGRVRKSPDEQYDTPDVFADGITNFDESSGFYGNPSQYDWKYIEKKEMYVPYNCNKVPFSHPADLFQPKIVNPEIVRWEKHRVWVLEATLHEGMRNVLSRRRIYIDEDTWSIVLVDSYDADNELIKTTHLYLRAIPAMPSTSQTATTTYNVKTWEYNCAGSFNLPPFDFRQKLDVIPLSYFDPQEMSANASF